VPAALGIDDLGGGVRQLTLAHPARRNALDDGLLEALAAAVADGAGVRAWLVRGGGEGIFSSGYDLSGLARSEPGVPLPDERIGEVFDALMQHPAPSVALVTGPAFGAGCELALTCDFRVGDAEAVFCMPPAKLGVVYALKGLERVVDRIGIGRARFMFLTGRRCGADEALRMGLLDVLETTADRARAEALALCRELAEAAPLAVAGMRRGFALLAKGGGTVAERAEYEALRRASFSSDDAVEGRAAILGKRAPRFQGR
jgi:enoyl-CoA hydratase/carnithine racemase